MCMQVPCQEGEAVKYHEACERLPGVLGAADHRKTSLKAGKQLQLGILHLLCLQGLLLYFTFSVVKHKRGCHDAALNFVVGAVDETYWGKVVLSALPELDPFVLFVRSHLGKVGLVQKPWRLLCMLLVAPYSDTVHVHPPLAHVCCVKRSLLLWNQL